MKLKRVAAGVGIALSVLCASAQAQGVIRMQDDDIDFALRPQGGDVYTPVNGALAVGDVLVAVFEMDSYTINLVNQIPAGQELTGISVIEIESIAGGIINFVPHANADFFYGTDLPDGAMIAMWLNGAPGGVGDTDMQLDFAVNLAASCTSLADCLEQASLGTLVQVDGFAGDADESWQAAGNPLFAGDFGDTTSVGAASPTQNVGTFQVALTTFFNVTGPIAFQNILTGAPCPAGTMAADDCVAGPTITGPLLGGAGLNAGIVADGAFARSDIDLQKLLVPEPGVLALLGLGLVGVGAARRRRA